MSEIANNTRFTVLDETSDYIVVDKPAPLKIHPSTPDGVPTLWDGLKALLAYELANGGQISIINRLDRETSGVVLVAKHARAARRFGLAMQRRQVRKGYVALVHGWPDWNEKVLEAPILRAGEVEESAIWVRQRVHGDGVPCETEFTVLARRQAAFGPVALVEARPKTGRMHQIRVHLAHLGHAVVGDKIYAGDGRGYLEFIDHGWTPELAERLHSPRQLLHSHELEVMALDEEGGKLRWQAPIPAEWGTWVADGERVRDGNAISS
jgi:23S rRNA pseudouridine1911/1915/1917 synthase